VNVDFLLLYLHLDEGQGLGDSDEDRFGDSFEFLSLHVVVQVVFFEEVLQIHGVLDIS
jgi:hypothetical protein